ncbi:protein of unknown function [Shewanella benthica]|uniref:Uncharacterized protein n=1 Tax=Shewanella benthica TaxID=43661 RepID=A0A330M464_9GAMM|nr:protein of unknown function [Shewanella benthica]
MYFRFTHNKNLLFQRLLNTNIFIDLIEKLKILIRNFQVELDSRKNNKPNLEWSNSWLLNYLHYRTQKTH